jgi:cell division cycle 20-like protein 1 (cofactor of APC complex)
MESETVLGGSAPAEPGSSSDPRREAWGSTSDARLPTSARKSPSSAYSDRFIPSRRGVNLQDSFALLPDSQPKKRDAPQEGAKEDNLDTYTMLLRSEFLGSESNGARRADELAPTSPQRNLFRYRALPSSRADENAAYALSPVGSDSQRVLCSPRKAPRKISTVPYKVLDAPALQDDFYLNLVDWSSLNVLAVGLGTCVYLWSACTSKVTKLCDLGPEDSVTSVNWTQRGTHLAVGTSVGEVQIWDAAKCQTTRTMSGHQARVGTLCWSGHMLSSGSRDRLILQRDVRVADHFTSKLSGHKQEVQFQMGPLDGLPDGLPDDLPDGLPHQVCGLKWSFDGQQLASGGNDNKLYVWSPHSTSPLLRFNEHTAAVKAISWSPHQNGLLASGGGTADRCIRFWNTQTASPLNSIDTGSQVCDGARHSQPRSACMCSPRRIVPSPQVCDRRVPLLAAQLLDCL